MPVSVQITLIIAIAVIAVGWFFAAVVRGQQAAEEAEANARAAEAMVILLEQGEKIKWEAEKDGKEN